MQTPLPMVMYCAKCGTQHIDEGEWAVKPHRTHLCQKCGNLWRPSEKATVGIKHPGLLNDPIIKGLTYMIVFLFLTEYCLGVWFGGFMGMAA